MFLGAGLVLTGCGDDDTTTTPAPAPAPPPPPAPEPEPEPPAPEAPATPTGLMVSETTETSITWTWNAVEGATGYQVQVSMDEMFTDEDATALTVEPTFTAVDLMPETSVYLRVRAGIVTDPTDLTTAILGEWTTHVTGMSAMPPPEPEPEPDPVSVSFSLSDEAESSFPMIPDDGDEEETAMASVNSEIMVSSNTAAIIEPMFVENASSVSVSASEDNMPFAFVDWSVLQSTVVNEGATFKVTRVTVGANQEMEPTGDVAYVTCGPFECQDGMDAPEIGLGDSATCNAWDPTLTLSVGVVDGKGTADDGDANTTADPIQAGFDIGWTYTANTAFTVKHGFGAFSASGGEHGKSSTGAALKPGRPPETGKKDRRNITSGDVHVVDVDVDNDGTDGEQDGCISNLYGAGAGDLDEPGGCFRLATKDNANFLSQYTVEMSPKDAAVAWGEIDWDAFEDLDCEPVTFVAAEQVDVCALLEDEVDSLGAAHPDVTAVAVLGVGIVSATTTGATTAPILDGFNLQIDTDQTRWTALRYYDSTTNNDDDTDDLYDDNDDDTEETTMGLLNGADGANVWIEINDADGNPMHGDLGKVDADRRVHNENPEEDGPFGGDDKADNYGGDASKCSADDGGEKTSTKFNDTADDNRSTGNGTLCDAEDVEIETSVTFTDGMGFDCSVERTYTLTCQWDASGGRETGSIGGVRGTKLDDEVGASAFVSCKVS